MNDRTPEPADAGDPDRFAPRAAGAMAGPAGTDLTGWSLVLYNGATSLVYGTVPLGGIVPDLQNGVGVLFFPIPAIQNGPDGLALVDPSSVPVQFLSYEGAFAALDGPAAGLSSELIGVAETSSTPVGYSLQLMGTGTTASSFSWSAPAMSTPGSVNLNQVFMGPAAVGEPPATFALLQNSPNPFEATTTIRFEAPHSCAYRLSIYDLAGRLVRRYAGNVRGWTSVTWDARDAQGHAVDPGIFYCRLQAGTFAKTMQMVLVN